LPSCKQATGGKRRLPRLGSKSVFLSTAYRLLRQVRTRGKAAFQDGRHGHPAKLRTAERTWLENYCHTSPHTSSRVVQAALQEQFGIQISMSCIGDAPLRMKKC